MNIVRLLIFSILISGFNNRSLQALTYTDAVVTTAAAGMGGVGIAWFIAWINDFCSKDTNEVMQIFGAISMIGGGIISISKTPHIRAWRARRKIKSCKNDSNINLAKKYYQKNSELVETFKQAYLYSDFPLVRAAVAMEKLGRNLYEAIRLLTCAKKDFSDDPSFVQSCETTILEAEELLPFINGAVTALKLDPLYTEQRKGYEQKIALEEIRNEIALGNISRPRRCWH